MDEQQQEAHRQRLEAERQKLTEQQKQDHDRYCASLKDREAYSADIAAQAARIIRTEYGVHRSSELQVLNAKADAAAHERDKAARREEEQEKERHAREAEAAKIEEAKAEQAREAERLKQQEAAKQEREQKEREAKKIAAHEIALREPIPGTIERFNAVLAQSKARRESETHAANIERGAEISGRPNYIRYDELKRAREPSLETLSSDKGAERPHPRGEMSEAKAERFAKMFDRPSSDKHFDATHDPNNTLNHSNGRGGRGR